MARFAPAAALLLLCSVTVPAGAHGSGTGWIATPTYGPVATPVSACEDWIDTVATPAGSTVVHGAALDVKTLGKAEQVDNCGLPPHWTFLLSRQFYEYTPAVASTPTNLQVTWTAVDVANLAAYAGSAITGNCHFTQAGITTTVAVGPSGQCTHSLLVAPTLGFTLAANAWTTPGGAAAGYPVNPVVWTVLHLNDGLLHSDTVKTGI